MAEEASPWWTKQSASVCKVSAGEPEACRFRTLVSTECKVELDQNGKHQRKCERIYRKFKDCPGRGQGGGSAHVISSEMGQLLEEVLAAFEKDFTLEGNSHKPQERVPNFQRNEGGGDSEQSGMYDGMFRRFFKKKPKSPSSNAGHTSSDMYGEYADDFQEV